MIDLLNTMLDFVSDGLLILGAVCVLIGGIGILRMPEFFTRLHAASLTDTMATLALFAGMMLQSGLSLATFKLFAIMAFLLLTGPTATYAMANSALSTGLESPEVDADEVEETTL